MLGCEVNGGDRDRVEIDVQQGVIEIIVEQAYRECAEGETDAQAFVAEADFASGGDGADDRAGREGERRQLVGEGTRTGLIMSDGRVEGESLMRTLMIVGGAPVVKALLAVVEGVEAGNAEQLAFQ